MDSYAIRHDIQPLKKSRKIFYGVQNTTYTHSQLSQHYWSGAVQATK